MKNSERRKHERVFFTIKEGIKTYIKRSDHGEELLPATLLSIGEGGVSFALTRVKADKIKEGDRLFIKNFPDFLPFTGIKDIEIVVRYIIDYDVYIYISFGCEFITIPDDTKVLIKSFVKKRLRDLEKENI